MITLAIIAGGKGSRMNYTNKAFLTKNNVSFVENTLKESRDFDEVIIITNDFSPYENLSKTYDFKLFKDIYKDKGAIGGIYTALVNAKNQKVFCVACDMPNLSYDLFDKMINHDFYEDILVPSIDERVQPLCAIYNKKLISYFNERIIKDENKMQKIIFDNSHKIIKLDNLEDNFVNVNTIEEYQKIK